MVDETVDGKRLWVRTVIDTRSRACPVMRIRRSATVKGVIEALEEACARIGRPKAIGVDQGSQFTSKELDLAAYANGVVLDFSGPGRPTDNAYAESFDAVVRLGCPRQHWFPDPDDAQKKVEDCRTEYNEVRPHSAIGDRTPMSLIHMPGPLGRASEAPGILS